jgi:signal transduction histidine kinase
MTPPRPTILAIDDTPDNLLALNAMLEDEFELLFASSGPAGFDIALVALPDLVLLDVMMPGVDGFATCKRFKSEPALRDIPIVFVTALADPQSELAGLALGAADFITKPIVLEIARHRIRNLLERERLHHEVIEHRNHLEDLVFARTLDLSIAKEAADAAQRAKTSFLSHMSHELRTPLNAIIGMTELAMLHCSDAQQGAQLGRALEAADRLLSLVSQLIDITEMQSGRLTLAPVSFKLRSVLHCVTRLLDHEARARGLEFRLAAAPGLEALTLVGDQLRLGQVLKSLSANAIRFTERGFVRVSVQAVERSATDIVLRFEVKDSGIGIAPADQQRIFEVFEQVDASTRRTHGGAGLGLALCKQLVELMGGAVGLHSEPGGGSAFWFTVRLSLVKPE